MLPKWICLSVHWHSSHEYRSNDEHLRLIARVMTMACSMFDGSSSRIMAFSIEQNSVPPSGTGIADECACGTSTIIQPHPIPADVHKYSAALPTSP